MRVTWRPLQPYRITSSGDPYDVAKRAHALVKRTKGVFTQPGKLESHLRGALDRLSGRG